MLSLLNAQHLSVYAVSYTVHVVPSKAGNSACIIFGKFRFLPNTNWWLLKPFHICSEFKAPISPKTSIQFFIIASITLLGFFRLMKMDTVYTHVNHMKYPAVFVLFKVHSNFFIEFFRHWHWYYRSRWCYCIDFA